MQIVPPTEPGKKPIVAKTNGKRRQAKSLATKETLHLKEQPKAVAAHAIGIDVADRIATAAYFLAECRGFEPGHELDDWLVAERQVRALNS
jgi:hypothetical protein